MRSQVKYFGPLTGCQTESYGFLFTRSEGFLRLRFLSASVVQVSHATSLPIDDFSYAVVAEPDGTLPALSESDSQYQLTTTALAVTVDKHNGAICFRLPNGTILNEDDPHLTVSSIGTQVTCYKKMQEGERFIGLGEKTGPLDRRGHGYQNWNTDAYSYHTNTDPLYCSMPFYIGIHHHTQYGIYLDNTHKSFFNFGASNNRFSSFGVDAGLMNYYFMAGDSVAQLLNHYTRLTGRAPLPPRWSLGFQQCRYSYYPDLEVRNTAKTFRDKHIPADAIVMDIHYMDAYKIFTWDKNRFPDPAGLIREIRSQGFEITLMCDPGIKAEPGYEPYDDGMKQDVFVKYPDGSPYTGQVWPGWCHFPDFTRPQTRAWWKEKLKAYADLGVEGYWNDMNEIATWGNMIPENLVFNWEGQQTTAREARNVYGFQMARSTYEATRALLPNRRPFNLTRSAFSGIQRYSAVWTGDNVSYDEHMMLGIRLVNSLGLTGVAFCGYDVGGFVGEASTRLFARWISLGALSPFFRGHTMINSKDAEPWSFGEEVEQIARNYIRLRYQLMPYLYSLFDDASRTGMPVQRALCIEWPHDWRVYQSHTQHQYLLGPSILVAPVESTKEFVKVLLPEGTWYSLFDGSRQQGNQEVIVESPIHRLPVFIRGGAVLPMQKPVQHTKEPVSELILHVYEGSGSSSFDLYQDDGSSFDHEKGAYSRRKLQWDGATHTLTLHEAEGAFKSPYEQIKLVLHGFDHRATITINEQAVPVHERTHSFFIPLEKYDPINEPDSMGAEQVQEATFDYLPGALVIRC